ncbi:MAG: hypothetical protein NC548_65300, partial [Lachnospiraceae bacterium]|nr:hypothetical protein [Lachnospiraceae bacterium]
MTKRITAAIAALLTIGGVVAGETGSVPMPQVEMPAKHADAPEGAKATATRKAAAKDVLRKAAGDGYTLMGYNFAFQYGNDPGNYRWDYDLNQEFLFQDPYTAKGYQMHTGWLRDGKLCGTWEFYIFDVVDYRYLEMDPFTGEISVDKKIYLQDPETQFYNYLPLYISAAYDPTDDRVYGYTSSETGNGYAFYSAPGNDPQQAKAVVASVPYAQVCASLCYNSKDGMFSGVNRDNNL